MIRVQCLYRFADAAHFDPVVGTLDEFKKGPSGDVEARELPHGVYARLGDVLVVLYRLGSSLWLRIGDVARDLDLDGVEVVYEHVDGHSRLALMDQGDVVAEVEYKPVFEIYEWDPTPFIEREDFDLGLFVHNVLRDEGRRARIYTGTPSD